jgi:spermidine/putrescine-binding protein
MWGTTGIGYNMKAREVLGDARIDSWDIVFKPRRREIQDCGVHFIDDG